MTRLQLITSEILPKGKCYLVCPAYDVADFVRVLANACKQTALLGAQEWYLTFREARSDTDGGAQPGNIFDGAPNGGLGGAGRDCGDVALPEGWAMRPYCDFRMLQKRLTMSEVQAPNPLHRKPLRAHTAELFYALYNEAFFDVPNATTMTQEEAEAILQDVGREGGFLMLGGMPVGTFLIKYCDGQPPEIAILGIQPALWGQGYGKLALRLLETHLMERGATAVRLLSASSNERAERLYRTSGFTVASGVSTWYEVLPKTQDVVGESNA